MQPTRILLKVKSGLVSMNRWVADNWVAFDSVVILWDVFLIPALLYLEKGIVFVIAIVISMFFRVFDDVEFKVGEDDPQTYLKVERLRFSIFRSFWVLLLVLIGITASVVIPDMHACSIECRTGYSYMCVRLHKSKIEEANGP